ncbi:unnamed protein product [Moneuplotes crassus]|uniref:S phase cyclin A-associated protein in the endoplasmic reticulum N-terminal domain-containing protein n=1 Tax=Euplotes crassus TaxID=5936 RepID=A0AAD1XCD2_EUPCR|nr:unnamed protein product [Moneuplotes crassus]
MSTKLVQNYEDKEEIKDEDIKVSTPLAAGSKQILKENSMMLDFTDYMSCTSGDDSDSVKDFRSRSYTPTKLFKRRIQSKMPASQLMKRLAEKQRKAQEKRVQILREKEENFRKAREKEKKLKQKLEEEAAQKLTKYNEKLEKAEIRKAQFLDNIVDKAKQEGEKLDENAFILSLTLQGKKIDLEDKIQINSERRQKVLDDMLNRTVESRERRHEAFNKKREILREQSRDKFLAKTARIESARKRKNQEVEKIKNNARAWIKKAIATRNRKKNVDNKINRLISMISNVNEEWEKCPAFKKEKNEIFEKKKIKLKSQAKVLDKIMKYAKEDNVNLTQKETEALLDDFSSDDEEDILYKSAIDQDLKAHSDSELDNDNIAFYFKNSYLDNRENVKDNSGYIDRFLIHSSTSVDTEQKPSIMKALSESPKNGNVEELKEPISTVGLSQDMLLKLDQQTKKQNNGNEIPGHGPMIGYYATPNIVTPVSNTKTVKPKKPTKLVPSKKYLAEMKPIIILLKYLDKEGKSLFVSAQVTLSHDIGAMKEEVKTPSTKSKMSKILENCSDFGSTKNAIGKAATPIRKERTISADSTDCHTKDASEVKEPLNSKENIDTKNTTQIKPKSSLRKSHEIVNIPSQEERKEHEINFERIMSIIFEEDRHLFRKTQANKIIKIDLPDFNLADFLENNSIQLRGCRICECTYEGPPSTHFASKTHKKMKEELGLKDQEDLPLSPIILQSNPGSIEEYLQKIRENAMKQKYKKLKQQMLNKGVHHDVASSVGKDITTASNKKKMQILSIELENKVTPTITEYTSLELKLNNLISIVARKRQEELHLLRKLKIIPWVIEILKKISVCPRNEIKDLVRAIELAIKILQIFVTTRENRDYMLSTNRVIVLCDLLIWSLNKPMHLFYGSTYVPSLFEVITTCLKHKAAYAHQQMKALLLEYVLCSPIPKKMKMKFESATGPLQLTGKLSLIPNIICKGLSFIEVITSIVGMDSRYRPVYDKSQTIGDSMYFVIQKTRLMQVIPLMMDVLFDKAQHPKEMLPKSILNLTFLSLKLINNMFRINLELCQRILADQILQDQFYYCLNYIVKYCYLFEDQDESKDILYETLLMIGYYTLMNPKGQEKVRSGEHSVLLKLCQLDISFFMDKQKKDILFPTLICLSYKDSINLQIIDNEMDKDYLKKYIKTTKKEELYNIPEDDLEQRSLDSSSICSIGQRSSHSISSTNSSTTSITTNLKMEHCPFIPFFMRFPKSMLDDALKFYSD